MAASEWTPEDEPNDVPLLADIPEAFLNENGTAPVLKIATGEPRPWLIDAADLLAEPDPGPTPWLVQDLIVDRAIIAAVGRWKTTKSYGLLDLCISIATGEPAFGVLEIPEPGPVIFINEESGRAALWRRLDALCRGRAINPERLRGRLHVAANPRIRLDNVEWQNQLLELGIRIAPKLIAFDPLARMKDPTREENEQSAMAVLLEFIRHLRDEAASAVLFVHHTGHIGEHMRGSSDLETVWETRLRWKREGQ
jgi:RecA-family ATPase